MEIESIIRSIWKKQSKVIECHLVDDAIGKPASVIILKKFGFNICNCPFAHINAALIEKLVTVA